MSKLSNESSIDGKQFAYVSQQTIAIPFSAGFFTSIVGAVILPQPGVTYNISLPAIAIAIRGSESELQIVHEAILFANDTTVTLKNGVDVMLQGYFNGVAKLWWPWV